MHRASLGSSVHLVCHFFCAEEREPGWTDGGCDCRWRGILQQPAGGGKSAGRKKRDRHRWSQQGGHHRWGGMDGGGGLPGQAVCIAGEDKQVGTDDYMSAE